MNQDSTDINEYLLSQFLTAFSQRPNTGLFQYIFWMVHFRKNRAFEYSQRLKNGQVQFWDHQFKAKPEVWNVDNLKTGHISYDWKPEYRTAKLDHFNNKEIFLYE